MKAVTVRLQVPVVTQNLPVATENYQEATIAGKDQSARLKLIVTDNFPKTDLDIQVFKRAILGFLEAGMSDTRIIKEVMGYEGGNYQRGKALLEELKRE